VLRLDRASEGALSGIPSPALHVEATLLSRMRAAIPEHETHADAPGESAPLTPRSA
jgi:hypothetical protein